MTTPTFIWNAVTGADSYRIMVATSSGVLPTDPTSASCGSCVINDTPTTAFYIVSASAPLNAGTTYYWQVHGRNATQYGTWSTQWFFATATAATPTPTATPTSTPSAHADNDADVDDADTSCRTE